MAAAEQPNILFICVDGQRWDTCGPAGRLRGVTPNLDRLAEEGVWFEHAYCVTAMCHPARASIMTGRYPLRHGITANSNLPFSRESAWPAAEVPFTAYLKRRGYRTGHIGLPHWGKSVPPCFGLDVQEKPQGAFWQQGIHTCDPLPAPRIMKNPLCGRWNVPPETTDTHFIADRAIAVLAGCDRSQPFALHVDWSGPHLPYFVPEPYASRFDPASLEPWPNFTARNEPGRVRLWRQYLGFSEWDWDVWSQAVAYYLGYIHQIDSALGRVLQALEKLRLASNTLVVYTSDHGEMAGGRGLVDKGPAGYDELYRVPLVARWPGHIAPGSTCDELVQTIDLCPTFLAAAGIQPEQELDGVSLLDTLAGSAHRSTVYCQFFATAWGEVPLRIVRSYDWKLVYSTSDEGECFHVKDDPWELRNLIDDPQAAPMVVNLQNEMLSWMEKTGDPLLAGARRLFGNRANQMQGVGKP